MVQEKKWLLLLMAFQYLLGTVSIAVFMRVSAIHILSIDEIDRENKRFSGRPPFLITQNCICWRFSKGVDKEKMNFSTINYL